MNSMEIKNMSRPDELRTLPKTKVEVVKLASHVMMRGTFEAGWKWSECVKPTVGTPSCQAPHLMYVISGKMAVKMDDGTQGEAGPGDAVLIAPGHDAWVIGDEPCVAIDVTAGEMYGKK
jgi:hypothetical protein